MSCPIAPLVYKPAMCSPPNMYQLEHSNQHYHTVGSAYGISTSPSGPLHSTANNNYSYNNQYEGFSMRETLDRAKSMSGQMADGMSRVSSKINSMVGKREGFEAAKPYMTRGLTCNTGEKYQIAPCVGSYLECDSNKFYVMTCPVGQVFDPLTKGCVAKSLFCPS